MPNKKHGIHIHVFGDITEGCKTAGPHYNPFNKTHGGLESEERHVGDLGNISADYQGNGYLSIKSSKLSLFGEHSVVGRSVVVHANADDEGHGNNE
jgi:Cu-Zn family superoxide dismutase